MPATLYSGLNGSEIRKIIKSWLSSQVDQIPGLKSGLTYKDAEIQIGIRVISHFDANIKTPEWDAELKIVDERIRNGQIEDNSAILLQLNNYIKRCQELIDQLENDYERETIMKDNGQPDKLRIENKLPIKVPEKVAGVTVEVEKKVEQLKFK